MSKEGFVPLQSLVERGSAWDKEDVEEAPVQKSGNVWGTKTTETKPVSLAQVQEEEKKREQAEKERKQQEERTPQGTYKPRRDNAAGFSSSNDWGTGVGRSSYGSSYPGSGSGGYAPRQPEQREHQPREKQPVPNNPPYTAYIGNLPYDKASEEALDDYFGDLGIEEIRVVRDNESGRPKGYAYIQFTHREGLEKALFADGEDFGGRKLLVDVASTRDRGEDRSRWGPREGGSSSGSGFGNFERRREQPERREDSRYDNSGPSSWRSQPKAAPSGPPSSFGPPKLGLQPRTKPIEEIGTPVRRGGEDPFGGASNDAEKLRRQTEERLKREQETERKRKEFLEKAASQNREREAQPKESWRGPREHTNEAGRGSGGGRRGGGGNDRRYDSSWGPGSGSGSGSSGSGVGSGSQQKGHGGYQRAPEQKKGPTRQEVEKAEAVANPFSVLGNDDDNQ